MIGCGEGGRVCNKCEEQIDGRSANPGSDCSWNSEWVTVPVNCY